MSDLQDLILKDMEENPPKRWGKWFLQIISNDKRLIEIGIGTNCEDGNYGPFQSKTKYFLWFYFTVAKPTLDYLKQTRNANG